MLISLPVSDDATTSNLQKGSLIEYEYCSDALGVKTARALAIVLRVDWRPRHARSHVRVLASDGSVCNVDVKHVCQIIAT